MPAVASETSLEMPFCTFWPLCTLLLFLVCFLKPSKRHLPENCGCCIHILLYCLFFSKWGHEVINEDNTVLNKLKFARPIIRNNFIEVWNLDKRKCVTRTWTYIYFNSFLAKRFHKTQHVLEIQCTLTCNISRWSMQLFLVNKISQKACTISYLPLQDKWLGSENRGEFSAYMEPKTKKLSNKFNRNKVMLQLYTVSYCLQCYCLT